MLDINLKFKIDHQALEACPPPEQSPKAPGNEGVTLPADLDDLIPGEAGIDSPFGSVIKSIIQRFLAIASEPDPDPEELTGLLNALRTMMSPGGTPLSPENQAIFERLFSILATVTTGRGEAVPFVPK